MTQTIALYGGTFNPIHFGHLIAARCVAEQLGAARTIFIPSAAPPHQDNTTLAPAEHRLEMVRRAVADGPGFEVSDCEIRRAGPSYTIDTVSHFRAACGDDAKLHWIIGADSLAELASWHRVDALADACHITTAQRPGFDAADLAPLQPRLSTTQIDAVRSGILNTPRIDISSTEIRRRIAEGLSVRYLVPESVRAYLLDLALYAE